MAGVDFYGIEQAVAERLRGEPSIVGTQVLTEGVMALERGPTIFLYIDRYDPAPGQPIAAGTRFRLRLRVVAQCYEYAFEPDEAKRKRDNLMYKVQIALMRQPSSFGRDDVRFSYLEGGSFETDREGDAFASLGEVVMIAEAMAIVD